MGRTNDIEGDEQTGGPVLDAILDSAHEAFISIDEEGRIRAWNREAERTFGWAREAVQGRLLSETIIPPRYRARHQEGLRHFLETGEGPLLGKRVEISALHRNGHEFPVELTISALHHEGRWSFHAFLHDISDRYRAHELQARLATLVEHSVDAIIARAADGRVTSWNPGAERLFGYSAEEMIGRTMNALVPPDRDGEADALLARASAGEPVHGFETERLRKDGSLIDVSITISPIRDDAGRVSELSMIARDIGERKRAERALSAAYDEVRRASELKSQFVAITSHELRTPLTSIGGFAQTLLARWEQVRDEDKRRLLESIDAQAARLRRLVDDLLLVSRIEAGRLHGNPRPVDLADTARAVAAELALDDAVTVEADEGVLASADPDHAHHVLVNYLENARRYGHPPYTVVVRGEEASVVVSVCDSGDGVDPQFVASLFDSFTQASPDRAGSGLGLAIVRGLAEAAGGEAWYEPHEPRGARFLVRLPRA
ncbi:MAG: PAS domain S-box protein [Thermoleophilia bacterium]|nr:PAS domain S-box protein [Thermoleophilia bacterium]